MVRIVSALVLVASLFVWLFVPFGNMLGEDASRMAEEILNIAVLAVVVASGVLLFLTRSKTTGAKVKLAARLVGILFLCVGVFNAVWIFVSGLEAMASFVSASAMFILVGGLLVFFTRSKE